MKVVAIINHKGGVGKTTLTANIGAGLAARGQKVLLIDLDAQASLTVSFFTQNEWTDELLPSRTIKHWYDGLGTRDAMEDPAGLLSSPPRVLGKLRRGSGHLDLIAAHRDLADVETALAAQLLSEPAHFATLHSRLRGALSHKALAEYDVVLIDCAPNFGLIAKNAVAAADMLLIPTKPDYLSTNGIDSLGLKIRDFTDEFNVYGHEHGGGQIARPPAAVVFTMVQSHDGEPIEAQRSVISRIEARRVPTFATTIRDSKSVYGPAPEHGVPVILGGTGRAATRELRDLVSELSDRLEAIASMSTTLTELAVRRALAALSPDDLMAVAAGRARLEVRPVEPPAHDPAQLGLYAETAPEPPVKAARPQRRPATPVPARDHAVDIAAVVARIGELHTPSAVDEYLHDPRFTATVLKQVARALGPTVLATGRSKAEVRHDIVAGSVGFRSRSAAMSGGAWA